MGAYEYKALQANGKTKSGVATADSPRQLRQILRDQGLSPISVQTTEEKQVSSKVSSTRQARLNTVQLAVVTRQFATLISSGMAVEESLGTLIDQSEGKHIKSILSGVRGQVQEGFSLVDSLRQYPRSFPEIYTASVSAGESTGKLSEVFERLADFTETRQNIRQKIIAALVYPIILSVVAVLIVVALLTFVVPQVVKVFSDTGQALPVLTQVLIAISDFVRDNGLMIMVVIIGGIVLFSMALKRSGIRYWLHGVFLKTPGIKRLSRSMNTAQMARTLAIMVGSGVPLLMSMRAGAEVLSNLVMKDALDEATSEVQEGASLSRSLARSGHFPPLLTQMVASGEQSGALDKMLEKSALALERELESRITVMVSLFEPLMILFMGSVVLVIVLAILLPIFDLNQLIG